MIGAGLVIYASDLAASRSFYADVLAMAVEPSEDGFCARLGELELHVEGGARPRKRGRHWMQEASAYVRLTTDDFDALHAGLEERGARLLGDVTAGENGLRYCGLADPDGILIEIAEVA